MSATPCTARATTPLSLTASGVPALSVPLLGVGAVSKTVDGELEPEASTFVTLEFGDCRDAQQPVHPTRYDQVVIQFPSGPLIVPVPVDVNCSVRYAGVGAEGSSLPAAADQLFGPLVGQETGEGYVSISAPATIPRSRPTMIDVMMSGAADWTRGCPGYVITIGQTETRRGLPCAVKDLLADVPADYQIQVQPAPNTPPGPTSLRFELLVGTIPTAAVKLDVTSQ